MAAWTTSTRCEERAHGDETALRALSTIKAHGALPDADYADVTLLATAVRATPEAWARAMFGDTPDRIEKLIWRGLLGLQLASGRRSQHTVAGWRIIARGSEWLTLEARSHQLQGNLIVACPPGHLALGTLMHYDGRRAALTWQALSTIHRRLAPTVLRGAERRLAR